MKKIILGLFAVMMLGVGVLVSLVGAQPVKADALNLCDDEEFKKNTPDLWEAAGCREKDDRGKTVFPAVKFIIEVTLGIIGIVGVGVIIYGGMIYITSTGDAAKVNRAKNIILYGVVGLIVAVLAYGIVEFVSKSIFG